MPLSVAVIVIVFIPPFVGRAITPICILAGLPGVLFINVKPVFPLKLTETVVVSPISGDKKSPSIKSVSFAAHILSVSHAPPPPPLKILGVNVSF